MSFHRVESLAPQLPRRPLFRAIGEGLRGRCPHCGKGHLFRAFLKVVDTCPDCGEAYHHHRADDAPPYFTMVIVGHLVVPLLLYGYMHWQISNLAHLAIWLPVTAILTLVLLQPVKGAVVAFQWALYMHGFDPAGADDELPMSEIPALAEPS
jgi:uncharacterized protein (DUF983 family)